ncbi:metallophosphoesterase [Natronogracilivirga saccharolytica]|uniref:Metallophosphoesterase n=1 Tax=Natronogracilivirga saccharolytica TaxID=2812953 RepID=A0A8J7RTY9_9BACT|nr:metallophosphoesterase [Natronogracilivirga saccharolytica]MBP3193859.1 metallophosphoesterase [Natronogracilivirga saccharolytica]
MPVKIPSVSRRKFLTSTTTAATGFLLGIPGVLPGKELSQYDAGEVDPNYFVLIADTHIDANPDLSNREGNKMMDINSSMVKRILEREGPQPSAVIINGDAANVAGRIEAYEHLVSVLKPLSDAGISVYITMGNHDKRSNFYEVFPEKIPEEVPVRNRHIEVLETPYVYLFLLDTLDQVNETSGILGSVQLHWLDSALKQYNDKPVNILGHHYPWPNIDRGLMDYDKFYDVIVPYDHVKSYIFGHSHRWDLLKEDGVHLVNQPANGGNPGSDEPTGIMHARFYSDKIELETDAFDRGHSWHGQNIELNYRERATTSSDQNHTNPESITLHDNFPNPFNPETNIKYDLESAGHVTLTVYDTYGQKITTLIDEAQSAGSHSVLFDSNKLGLSSGTYVYRIKSNGTTLSQTMTLIK